MQGFVAGGGADPPGTGGASPSGGELAQVVTAVHALAALVRHIEMESAHDDTCAGLLEQAYTAFSIALANRTMLVLEVCPDALNWGGCEVWQDDPELAQLAGRLFQDGAQSVVITSDAGEAGVRSLAAALVGAADPRHLRIGDAPTLAYRSAAAGIGLSSAFRNPPADSADLDLVDSPAASPARPFAWALPPAPPVVPATLIWSELEPSALDELRAGCATNAGSLGKNLAEQLLAQALRCQDPALAAPMARPLADLLAVAARTDDRAVADRVLELIRKPEVRVLCNLERLVSRSIDDTWLRMVIGGLPPSASRAPPTLLAVLSTLSTPASERLALLVDELAEAPRDLALVRDLQATLQGKTPPTDPNEPSLPPRAGTPAGRAALLPLQQELVRQRAPAADRTARLVRRLGVDLVRGLASSLHTAELLGALSEALDERLERLEWTLSELYNAVGPVSVALTGRTIAVHGVPLYFPRGGGGPGPLRDRMAAHGCGRLDIYRVPSRGGLRHLVACLVRPPAPRFQRAALRRRLSEGGVTGIDALPPVETMAAVDAPRPIAAQEALAESLVATWEAVSDGRGLDTARMRRAVVDVLKVGVTGDALWSAMVQCDPPTWHGVSSVRLALLVGAGLELSRSELIDLGVGVALRDVGYLAPAVPSEGAPESIAGDVHCQVGARVLLDRCGTDPARTLYATVALQHHTPWQAARHRLHAFSRIAAVADSFANLTFGAHSLAPAHALALIAAEGGRRLDPAVVTLLVRQLGAYPPGSRVRTPDGTQGFSISVAGSKERFARPRILVDLRSDGSVPVEPTVLDLCDPP